MHQRAEHGRLEAAAGADLQHLVARLRIDRFGHVGHHEGRRNGLPLADGQGHVEIGVGPLGEGNKFVPRRLAHGVDDAGVLHARPHDFLVHHLIAGLGPRLPSLGVDDRRGQQQRRRPGQGGTRPIFLGEHDCCSFGPGYALRHAALNWIQENLWVTSDDCQALANGLCHEHTVERVAMMSGK